MSAVRHLSLIVLIVVGLFAPALSLNESVFFKFFKDGKYISVSNGTNAEQLESTGCTATDQFSFLFHGWRESCETEWVSQLIEKLTTYRGGCIICVDYALEAFGPYQSMMRKFNILTGIVVDKLKYLNSQGMEPDKVFMFGFSYGGQLAVSVGKSYGPNLINEIDTCDMAGPGFDSRYNMVDHREAAQNVQCIHTSGDKGTKQYACHQNWRMGNCGMKQMAKVKGSHGMCPIFYISAFENPFYAEMKPMRCRSRNQAASWPENYQMGYMETRKPLVNGELFALTSRYPPYNVPPPQLQPELQPEAPAQPQPKPLTQLQAQPELDHDLGPGVTIFQ